MGKESNSCKNTSNLGIVRQYVCRVPTNRAGPYGPINGIGKKLYPNPIAIHSVQSEKSHHTQAKLSGWVDPPSGQVCFDTKYNLSSGIRNHEANFVRARNDALELASQHPRIATVRRQDRCDRSTSKYWRCCRYILKSSNPICWISWIQKRTISVQWLKPSPFTAR